MSVTLARGWNETLRDQLDFHFRHHLRPPTGGTHRRGVPLGVGVDATYDAWSAGVVSLGEEGLARPVGPAEGPFAESPYADLVLHINRELIHHGAEICLLRDLYRHREEPA